jgi:hypothetical protein
MGDRTLGLGFTLLAAHRKQSLKETHKGAGLNECRWKEREAATKSKANLLQIYANEFARLGHMTTSLHCHRPQWSWKY